MCTTTTKTKDTSIPSKPPKDKTLKNIKSMEIEKYNVTKGGKQQNEKKNDNIE